MDWPAPAGRARGHAQIHPVRQPHFETLTHVETKAKLKRNEFPRKAMLDNTDFCPLPV